MIIIIQFSKIAFSITLKYFDNSSGISDQSWPVSIGSGSLGILDLDHLNPPVLHTSL